MQQKLSKVVNTDSNCVFPLHPLLEKISLVVLFFAPSSTTFLVMEKFWADPKSPNDNAKPLLWQRILFLVAMTFHIGIFHPLRMIRFGKGELNLSPSMLSKLKN